jgi:urease accessory protein
MLTLTEKLDRPTAASDTLTLPYENRIRSRLRVRLDSGREATLKLPRGLMLHSGDRLVAVDGTVIEVRAAVERVSTGHTDDRLLLARACYHLGNRHVPLQVTAAWVRYQHDHVLDAMLEGLGLVVIEEQAPFQPEAGAYAAGGHVHAHAH